MVETNKSSELSNEQQKKGNNKRNRRGRKSQQRNERRKDEGRKKKVPSKVKVKSDIAADAAPNMRKRIALVKSSSRRVENATDLTKDTLLLHTEEAGCLEPENEMEQTLHVRQKDIVQQSDLATIAKASFSLDLSSSNLNPYTHAVYSRSGRSLLIASRKGHFGISNWRQSMLQCEEHLNETIRDVTFLHNDAYFATAQKEHAFIYDAASGAQIHILRKHREPGTIVSLPHHLLLATTSALALNVPHAQLVYTDTTNGEIVACHDYSTRTLGISAVNCATVNLSNGVLHTGHVAGAVALWSPIVPRPLARIFCHAGGVRHVAIKPSANGAGPGDMVTTGGDGIVKVTDLRTFKTRTSWRMPSIPTALATSIRGVLAISFGATVQVWAEPESTIARAAKLKDQRQGSTAPYMSETLSGRRITSLEFCPFEDILAVCHTDGMLSLIVPGSGEATFDSSAPNPYETRKQRREAEVRSLLDKLPLSSIALDSTIVGSVDNDPQQRLKEIKDKEKEANVERLRKKSTKKRAKGRNKISKRLQKRQSNIIDAKRLELEDQLEQQRKTRERAKQILQRDKEAIKAGTMSGPLQNAPLPDALNRFFPKKTINS